MWIPRENETTLQNLAGERPAVIVTGARQAGKTSLLRRVFPDYDYVSLDLPLLAEEAEESGGQFLDKHAPPLMVDEVQYAPRLFRYIKASIDARRDQNGLYLLTGSQKFTLMQGVTESLAGRAAILDVYPLSLRELEAWSGRTAEGETLLQWMLQGSYPELHAKDLNPERFYSDYVATYLERDVRQVVQVKSLRDFDRFLRLAAASTGQLLSMASMASSLGISPNTVKSWLSVLEASNIVFFLEPYYRNLGKRIVKSPKLYFLDTGLAAFLTGFRSVNDLRQSALLGAFFETLVLGQIVRRFAGKGQRSNVYFFQDHSGREVDFLIPVGEKMILLECKWSETPPKKLKGFQEIAKLVGPENILSQSIITPVRGTRGSRESGFLVEDCVDLPSLDG
jgi:predicted AAA+ superfamily ATPase